MKSHRGRKDQVFIRDPALLELIARETSCRNAPFLDVGAGDGAILSRLPRPRMGIEVDQRFRQVLAGEDVIWGDFLTYDTKIPARTVVGNLPFARAIFFILHARKICPDAEVFLVIVQEAVGRRILGRGKLGFLFRRFFLGRTIAEVPSRAFQPVVKVNGILLELSPLPGFSAEILSRVEGILKKIVNPRKKLRHFFELPSTLGQKRIDELSDREEELLARHLGCA